ncbi:MAG: NusG domain II-containing protein [Clostridia bacterium]|nr:NusG domain II-containing protein [Clostridia bacterium]
MFRTKVTVWDIVSMAAVLLVAALIWVPFLHRDVAAVLVVTTDVGSTEYSLSEDRAITVTSRGHTLHIQIGDGAVFVTESDCLDGDCKARGAIRYAGESILCAPAGVTLTVKGGETDVDFVAG